MSSSFLASYRYNLACWLRVTGADAASFLQGQFTNDLRGLAPGQSSYGLWLDVKGKVTADSFVLAGWTAGEFWIASYFCPGSAVRSRLESFIIADEVVIEDAAPDWTGLALIGGQAPAAAASLGYVFPGRRAGLPSWEIIHCRDRAVPGEIMAGRREADAAEMERLRIAARIPAVPRDVGPGDLPHEGGLQDTAISYSKGCYLGQEIMARLQSRGNARRRLFPASGPGPAPAAPAPLWQDGRQAGELRSAAAAEGGGFIGLAVLALGGLKPEAPLSIRKDETPQVRLGNSC